MPSIVTANVLRSGEVVYLADGATWTRRIGEAAVATDKPALAAFEAAANTAVVNREVTAVYAMDVVLRDGAPHPISVRETIRAALGPSV
jgi:Protein of unknown function (DUF2849)